MLGTWKSFELLKDYVLVHEIATLWKSIFSPLHKKTVDFRHKLEKSTTLSSIVPPFRHASFLQTSSLDYCKFRCTNPSTSNICTKNFNFEWFLSSGAGMMNRGLHIDDMCTEEKIYELKFDRNKKLFSARCCRFEWDIWTRNRFIIFAFVDSFCWFITIKH